MPLHKHYHPIIACLCEFAFFTGLRTSELYAIKWKDIDNRTNKIVINKANVRGQLKNTTKTNKVRYVELNQDALRSLETLKPHTYAKNKELFINLNTGRGYTEHSEKTLKAAGLRYRITYQTRHTFATMYLMHGANPMWVAKQLDHTTMNTLLNHYAKWINDAKYSDVDLVDSKKMRQKCVKNDVKNLKVAL